MCYIPGSAEHVSIICPMCKVFRPTVARCPHIKDTCTNRENHPRHDVVFMRNAEVQTFNGCGYCKWVRFANSPKGQAMISASGGSGPHPNHGWPGCCRAPASNEYKLVPAADWPSVSIVHHVNMPPEIRVILDKIIASANAANRAGPPMPPVERRDSGGNSTSGSPTSAPNASGSGKSALSPKSPNGPSSIVPGILAAKNNRAPNSPTQTSSSPVSPRSAGSGGSGGGIPSAVNPTSPRTVASVDRGGPRAERSPVRKNPDLEASISRRGTVRRTTITGPSSPFSNAAGGAGGNPKGDSPTEPIRKTSLLSSSTTSLSASNKSGSPKPSPPSSRSGDGSGSGSSNNPTPTSTISRAQARNNGGNSSSGSKPSLEVSMSGLKLVSNPPSSASSSGGSSSDFTVTSDGAFTDYLSDESEAELQRQAEARAALVAQNYAEEQEFRAARERLTHVDLRPPRAWDAMQQRSQAKV